jgi:23S rRNA (uracil1939-C5)-methyltransferase
MNHLEVTAMSSEGKGIARSEGLVVFIDQCVTGDVVDARVYRKKSGYREASPLTFHTYSPLRELPVCQHFGVCGGCKWQNLKYGEQLNHKQKQVSDALTRIGKLNYPEVFPILAAPEIYRYRNKMEYTFSDSRWITDAEIESQVEISSRIALGFHIPGRFDKILDIENCHLQHDTGNRIRLFIRREAEKAGIPFFNLREQTGILRTLLMRNNAAGEWMICLSVTSFTAEVEQLLHQIHDEFPEITSLFYAVNAKRNDSMTDIDPRIFKGQQWITEEMEKLRFRIHPKSFYQTNTRQALELYRKTREFAGLTGSENVYDLYTGTGTIALFLAEKAAKVTGVEYVEEAVIDARQNAIDNGISNASFFAGDMKDILTEDFFTEHGKPDVIITDPPRAGMHELVTKRILESGADRIVYVSCNPSTQARDLAILDEKYSIKAVQPVDMFPQTTHVENIVLLELKKYE